MSHPSPTLSSRLAARLAPWVLRRLDPSRALRLLAEGARRLPDADGGTLADAMLSEVLADLRPHVERAGWRLERLEERGRS